MSTHSGKGARAYNNLTAIIKSFDEEYTIYDIDTRWRERLGTKHVPTSLRLGQMLRRLITSNLIEKVGETNGGRGTDYYPVTTYVTLEPEITTSPRCVDCDTPMTTDNTLSTRKKSRCGECYLKHNANKRHRREN
jgi:hypothetical protein